MEILRLLDQFEWIDGYELQDYRQWDSGFYYRLKLSLLGGSTLFVREYVDEAGRDYSFHWQDQHSAIIARWDNAPHHRHLATFPHHKHTAEGVVESTELSLSDVLAEIANSLVDD